MDYTAYVAYRDKLLPSRGTVGSDCRAFPSVDLPTLLVWARWYRRNVR